MNKNQLREWLKNELLICKRCNIVYLTEYAELRRNLSMEARDAEIERGIDQELEDQAEPEIHWEPAFL
jgi:hypothetical protein